MGLQTIVHGRISLRGNFEKSRQFIKSISDDDKYPWIRSEMFSIGASERPYFYGEPIIGFASDYKGLEYDCTSFILKFENVLRNIDFDTAKIQMETEFYGTYNFFWKSKINNDKFEKKEKLIETNEWYFGFGYRNQLGLLIEDLIDEHVFSMDFEYPINFDSETLNQFNELIKGMEVNQIIEIGNKVNNYEKLFPILTYGHIHKMLDYGLESEKGYWIKKLKNIEIK